LFFSSGSTLIKCGQIHQKLGQTYKDFIQSAAMGYIQPLKSYLEGEMKSITVNIQFLIIFILNIYFRKNVVHWK